MSLDVPQINILLDELIAKHGVDKIYLHLHNIKNDNVRYNKDLILIKNIFQYSMKVFNITKEDIKAKEINKKSAISGFRKTVSYLLIENTSLTARYIAKLLNVNNLEPYRYRGRIKFLLDHPESNKILYNKVVRVKKYFENQL